MSKIINKGGFKPGCIYRIALENFVTYKEVELYPCKSLNLIIGPNGTGKSTFVCAIILGLCGKPSAIGRAKTISEFVRHDCQTASIEIELYNNPGERNIIIKRTFNLQDVSTWSINYKTVTEKKVQERIKSFNIQVDNLCQLLPQDRVQDFSKMNPKELLHSTLTAVGRFDSIQEWEKLIKLNDEQTELASALQNGEKRLENEMRQNERLKETIDAMNKREAIEKEIDICDKKQLWVDYKLLYDKVAKFKRDVTEAEAVVKKNENVIKPLKKELDGVKRGMTHLEEKTLEANRTIQDLKDQLKETIKVFEMHEMKLKDLDESFKASLTANEKRKRELVEAKAKVEKLVTDKRALEREEGDENKLILELEKLEEQKRKTNASMETQRNHKAANLYPLDNEIRSLKHKIRNLEDVQKNRLNNLATYQQDTYKALMWLRENRDKFQHPVHEPMMLEINFTDPKFARYLESTVAARDLKAFTFESKDDMNLFTRIVRGELKLKQVNSVHSEGGEYDVQTRDIRNLSYLGFYTYLSDTITAPTAIMRYLCTGYRINNIPVGNKHTYDNIERVPDDIRYYFTENHRITVRVSYYGVKSSTTIEIREPNLLADSVDEELINKLQSQLFHCEQRKQAFETEIDSVLTVLGNTLHDVEMKRREKSELVNKLKSIKMQIHRQQNNVRSLENRPAKEIEETSYIAERERYVIKQCKSHREMLNIMNGIQRRVMENEQCRIQLTVRGNAILQKDSEYRKIKSEIDTAKTALENLQNHLKTATSAARRKLGEAKASCGGLLLQDSAFPYGRQFAGLPDLPHLLREHREQRVAQLALMQGGDTQVLKDYENREKEIKKLKDLVASSSSTKQAIKDKINEIKSSWLPPLESLVQEISSAFGSMFQKVGCVGRVDLYKGANDEEYASFGLRLLLQFRAGERPAQLTRHAQSGGERALATALYLLALQARARVPFRCVDEINQGMDTINERKMLELLIEVTTESDSQYFLLTPKLLLDLEYNEKIMIHTIMNGDHIMNYKKWRQSEFLKNAIKMNQK